ncbi:hypothetical protein [Amycolatopsis sp. H20-H5]|uniref:hypothetical protein n=1 Tax=Amycolatopsis sp. H20-H5 TaxID=3046309 RepID=UPI002DBE1821|nr:hypothetical protein [Amycolatopsis sp. H20-H5]MEC3974681.1 hypothetical protein [Amycolatopsis sp. H20-H5]
MQGRTRRATAVGATALVLAGSAVLGLPGTASAAETKTAACGGSVTAKPGDTIFGTTPLLGIPLNLGNAGPTPGVEILTGTINALLNTLCRVTVTVVDTVIAPVPVIGAPVASAVNQGVVGTSQGLGKAATDAGKSLSGSSKPAPAKPGTGGNPQQPPAQGGGPGGSPAQGGTPAGSLPIPDANSPLLPGTFSPNFGGLPFDLSTGYSPMRDYSSIPMALAGLFTPSPGLRYGSQIPGYAPQFGLVGPDGTPAGNAGIQNAGQAEALPTVGDGFSNGSQWPVLIAVLALSGVSAGLVRTWVLRRMIATS